MSNCVKCLKELSIREVTCYGGSLCEDCWTGTPPKMDARCIAKSLPVNNRVRGLKLTRKGRGADKGSDGHA